MKSENMLRIIGLTGQSGSGKSEVSRFFESKGIKVINADLLARLAHETDECKNALREYFGDSVIDAEGKVDRKAVAKIAFSSEENTKKLNKATHPVIIRLAKEKFAELEAAGERLVLFDAPTLLESGLDSVCYDIISVIADKEKRLSRIIKRDSLTKDEALLRLNAQQEDSFYTDKSRFVIVNNGTLEELKAKTARIFEEVIL